MYHTVYVTTNVENGKFYIGKHSTVNLKDGYCGSGAWVKKSKSNKNHLETRVLKMFDDENSAYAYEHEAITISKDVYSDLCMNKQPGGWGLKCRENHHYFGKKLDNQHREKMKIAHLNKVEKRSKKVMCIESGQVYDSLSIAARLGVGKINSRVEIRKCCMGLVNIANGLTWKFVD
jgi:hypothetical protein